MVSSKKTHCAFCQKKCSGNVLRYQDRYYHKQCFELEQAKAAQAAAQAAQVTSQQQQQFETVSNMALTVSSDENMPPSPAMGQHQSQRHLATVGGSPTKSRTIDSRYQQGSPATSQQQQNSTRLASNQENSKKSATLPHSISSPSNGFLVPSENHSQPHPRAPSFMSRFTGGGNRQANSATTANKTTTTNCAGCRERISDGQALIALDLHWHVWCFKCAQCRSPLHGEYVAKEGRAYCEKDYQKLFGITCVYCKRYITGKVLQAGEAHHFHPSCARCSKCGDPFVPGEEMYLQGEVTWHPRCGPSTAAAANAEPHADPAASSLMLDSEHQLQVPASGGGQGQSPSLASSRSRSRSASPFSYMSSHLHRGRASPGGYAESEAVGDLSRIYTISYLNADPNQGYLRRPIEPHPPKSPQFSRPTSLSRLGGGGGGGGGSTIAQSTAAPSDRSRCSSRSQQNIYGGSARERSIPRGMYSVLSSMRSGGSSMRARSPSMMNDEAIALASYPSGQKPPPDSLAPLERDDFPAPPFPHADSRHHHHSNHHSHQNQRHNQQSKQQVPTGHDDDHHRQVTAVAQENGHQEADANKRVSSNSLTAGQGRADSAGQERASRPRSREIVPTGADADSRSSVDDDENSSTGGGDVSDPKFRKEEEELSKIANGIGKIFLQTLKEREKLRAWKRANLDPRNASRTPSATRELPSRPLRYENPTNASPSRDLDRPRAWVENGGGGFDDLDGDQSPTRTRSSLGRSTALSNTTSGPTAGRDTAVSGAASALSSSYGYKVIQSNRSTPRPGYGLSCGPYGGSGLPHSVSHTQDLSFAEQQRVAQSRAADLLGRSPASVSGGGGNKGATQSSVLQGSLRGGGGSMRSLASSAHFRRSMPNVAQLQAGNGANHHSHNIDNPPKLYPYHLLATSNYRLPPGVDRCHLERHLSNEEFQYIFHCDRLDFYRLPEWKRNELKRRARLF